MPDPVCRGAVLVGAARVDAALERLLQAVVLPAAGASNTFFQPDRPLGSFGARITLAARLGLIEPPMEQALQTLRRVHNVFPHSTTTATLTDPGHADRLAPAYAAARSNTLWQPLERILQEKVGGDGLIRHHGGLNHSASFVSRLRPRWFFRAMTRALFPGPEPSVKPPDSKRFTANDADRVWSSQASAKSFR